MIRKYTNGYYTETREIYLRLYKETGLSDQKKVEDYNEYISRIRSLAYKGNANAQYDLAQHYEDTGYFGIPNPFFNSTKRFYWYSKASNNNHAAAYNQLGYLIEHNEDNQKDLTKALDCYRKSMELGDDLGKKNYKKMLRDLKDGGIYNSGANQNI